MTIGSIFCWRAAQSRRRGVSALAYGLIVGLVSVVALSAISRTGTTVNTLFSTVSGRLRGVQVGGGAAVPLGPERASCAAHLAAGSTSDGVYQITGVGGLYCDMTSDGGGWTLVYKNKNSSPRDVLTINTTTLQGSVSCLANLTDNCSAKLDDTTINAIRTAVADEQIGYRVTSPQIGNRYFFPRSCVYSHVSHGNTECRRWRASFATGLPGYTQFINWGGGSGGLDAWYNGSSYNNVANTHRNYTETSGITTNSGGSVTGNSDTLYSNSIYMWVR